MKYLNDYSFEDQFWACYDYALDLDWKSIATEIMRDKVISFNISSAVNLFSHLTLDEDYELYAYIGAEYHGLWGRVAAVKKGESTQATVVEYPRGPVRTWFNLPETAVYPLSVIYADGSPYGYLDAIIAENFFRALPYMRHENRVWGICLCEQPKDYPDSWSVFVDIPDWSPRIKQSGSATTILLCWGMNTSKFGIEPKIRITLKEFIFYNGVFENSMLLRGSKHGMYCAHITDARRYRAGRHCCLFDKNGIVIAEKE